MWSGLLRSLRWMGLSLMSDLKDLHAILDTVSRVYHGQLVRSGSGRRAREYLSRRWVFPHAVDEWRLGWCPEPTRGKRPWIIDQLEGRASIAQLKQVGVLVETEHGLIDPMAGRLVFPQTVPSGHVAGFVGRVIEATAGKDKYLATPRTDLFRRSEILYRMDIARLSVQARSEVMVVEGLLDAVLMWQVGARHVVATGTSGMTEAQAQILSRYAKRLVVMFDADEAGEEGSNRVRDERGVWFSSVESLVVPQGAADPAEWAQRQIAQRISG